MRRNAKARRAVRARRCTAPRRQDRPATVSDHEDVRVALRRGSIVPQGCTGKGGSEMKIVVFGPTGMVGSRIVAELEQRGHEVVGACRSGGTDVTDPDSVASAAAGADAVVCAVSARGVDYTLGDVARSLVDGVRRAGARRLVTVGGTGSLGLAAGVAYVETPGVNDEYQAE